MVPREVSAGDLHLTLARPSSAASMSTVRPRESTRLASQASCKPRALSCRSVAPSLMTCANCFMLLCLEPMRQLASFGTLGPVGIGELRVGEQLPRSGGGGIGSDDAMLLRHWVQLIRKKQDCKINRVASLCP